MASNEIKRHLDISPGLPTAAFVPGKLAVLTPGMGAVATTLYAGVEAIKRELAAPVGSYTQMGEIKLDRQSEYRKVRDLVPLADLTQLEFGGWDIFPDNAYEAACHAGVLEAPLLQALKEPLQNITPMKGVFDQNFVRRLSGTHIKTAPDKMKLAELLREDIRNFMAEKKCQRAVMVWCGSTEVYQEPSEVHLSLRAFEQGLKSNSPEISPSQIYAYASLKERVPYTNGSPNPSVELPYLSELALEMQTPICGSDFKTGQTLMKTIIAPGLRNRQLGVRGWFSTNILGNRDGEVLDDPGSFRSKEVTKTSVLKQILSADRQPELYSDLQHMVRIHYYRPRGDNKEGWDNIDIFGWLGYPMQIKVNFLCRDSILAAPLALDLALLMDLAGRKRFAGIQEWLGFYFKSPLTEMGQTIEHELSLQLQNLEAKLLEIAKDHAVTPLDHLSGWTEPHLPKSREESWPLH